MAKFFTEEFLKHKLSIALGNLNKELEQITRGGVQIYKEWTSQHAGTKTVTGKPAITDWHQAQKKAQNKGGFPEDTKPPPGWKRTPDGHLEPKTEAEK